MIERDEHLVDLFAAANDLAVEDRAAFLARECAGQPTLLAEIESMLGAHAKVEARGFMHERGLDQEARETAAELSQAEHVGQTFGRYQIRSLIGEGGMGEVYLATDTELDRQVAIKLIKSNLKTRELLRRFTSERQILAHLNHDNIARLLDVGTTDEGYPFLVMEYVDGQPIDTYCEAKELSIVERAKLFRAVCAAVQYAHQNLIVHRDLKPSNVLVTSEGQPKLLDFGISKLLDPGQSGEATATMMRVMTPEYASPEQIKGEPITTASDVYSLGVLLYQLLTGCSPYKLKRRTTDEVTKAVCEQEPARPSSAVKRVTSAVSEARPPDVNERSFAATPPDVRKVFDLPSESVKSSSGLRPDQGQSPKGKKSEGSRWGGAATAHPAAELQKKSSTRVGTLNAVNPKLLRGDLDNIVLKALRKEPARRYQSVGDFSEDIRRHLEGLPVSARKATFSYRASKFIQRNKIGVAAAALVVLTLAGGIVATTVEARRANRRFNEVRQLAHTVLFDYHDQIAALPGSTKVRERLVKDALQYLDNLSKDAGNDVSLLRELAVAYAKVASVQGGGGVLVRGYGRFISTSNLGDTRGALESMRKAVGLFEQLAARQPRDRGTQIELAYSYQGLASLYSLPGPPEKVLEYVNKAIPILEASMSVDPTNEEDRLILASSYTYKAKALGSPGNANLGDTKGAMEFLSKGQSIFEKLAADHPTDAEYQHDAGGIYNLAGLLATANGNEKEALDFNLKAVAVDQRIVDLDPNNTSNKNELAIQTGNAGSSMMKLGDTAGALEKFRQALAIYESMIAADPNDASTRRNAGVGYRNVGVATGTDNRAEALKNFNKALEIFAGLVAKDASNGDFRRQWAYTYLALSRFQVKANDLNGAVESVQQGINIDEVLVASSPTNASARNTQALLYRQLGDSHAALGTKGNKQQWTAAKNAYQKALDIYQDMKSKGTLNGADASKPDELAKEIAKCDEALAGK